MAKAKLVNRPDVHLELTAEEAEHLFETVGAEPYGGPLQKVYEALLAIGIEKPKG